MHGYLLTPRGNAISAINYLFSIVLLRSDSGDTGMSRFSDLVRHDEVLKCGRGECFWFFVLFPHPSSIIRSSDLSSLNMSDSYEDTTSVAQPTDTSNDTPSYGSGGDGEIKQEQTTKQSPSYDDTTTAETTQQTTSGNTEAEVPPTDSNPSNDAESDAPVPTGNSATDGENVSNPHDAPVATEPKEAAKPEGETAAAPAATPAPASAPAGNQSDEYATLAITQALKASGLEDKVVSPV